MALRDLSLYKLKCEANHHHFQAQAARRKAEKFRREALEHALEAGCYLCEAKSRVEHGEWLDWLQVNFKGSPRAAQQYMRIWRKRQQLLKKAQQEGANAQRVADLDLSLRAALDMLRTERRDATNAHVRQPRQQVRFSNTLRQHLREEQDDNHQGDKSGEQGFGFEELSDHMSYQPYVAFLQDEGQPVPSEKSYDLGNHVVFWSGRPEEAAMRLEKKVSPEERRELFAALARRLSTEEVEMLANILLEYRTDNAPDE